MSPTGCSVAWILAADISPSCHPESGRGPWSTPDSTERSRTASAVIPLVHRRVALAQRLHDVGEGDRHTALVVRRSKHRGPPAGMDLLVDPVSLVLSGQLHQDVDGYEITYRTGDL